MRALTKIGNPKRPATYQVWRIAALQWIALIALVIGGAWALWQSLEIGDEQRRGRK